MKDHSDLKAGKQHQQKDRLISAVKSLGCAVISNAFQDVARDKTAKSREDATAFIMSERLDWLIELYGLNLNSSYVRRALIEGNSGKQRRRR